MKQAASNSLKSIIIQGFKENIKPGLVLQAMALTLVLLYYFHGGTREILEVIGSWKLRYGYLYSGLSTALFGGLFPFIFLLFQRRIPKGQVFIMLAFYLLFWIWKGMEVDLFYRMQAGIFGDSNEWQVVFKKVLVDQLIYAPLWASPTMTICYLWKDAGFSFTKLKEMHRQESFFRRWIRIMIPNTLVWLPAVAIIYNLPLLLQIPLFNLVLAFWTLILNTIAEK